MFSGRVPHAMRNRLKSGMYPRTRPANLPSSTVVSIDPRVCPICRDYCRPCDFELYRVEETPSHPEFGVLSSKSRTAPTEKLVERQEHQVHIQCLLYAASFTNSLLWGSIQNILRAIDTRQNTDLVAKNVWLFIPVVIFYPLQGLFNFLIFIRPRVVNLLEEEPESTLWNALRSAVFVPYSVETTSSQSRVGDASHLQPQPKSSSISS
mmetsp:Transcript_1736/g.3794  ORF Transcript_1736/g.3794 Transcript_1736/m.3794 type:complete len:208 (-) Transcript_1736:1432-2055(-)